MKRFALLAAAAVAVGLWSNGPARAQYASGYTVITPGGAVVTNRQVVGFGGVQQYRSVATPFGVKQQAFYGDAFGNTFGRASGYNAFTGYGFNSGFYNPGPFVPRFAGYNYGFYGRRW